MPPATLERHSKELIAILEEASNHSDLDVRRLAVFSLVEARLVVGETFDSALAELSGNSQKLVAIYLERRLSEEEEEA